MSFPLSLPRLLQILFRQKLFLVIRFLALSGNVDDVDLNDIDAQIHDVNFKRLQFGVGACRRTWQTRS